MTKKKTTITKTEKEAGMTPELKAAGFTADPKKEGIPVALQTQNRRPSTPEQQARIDAMLKDAQDKAAKERKYFDKPKGMSVEEWEAHLAAKEATKAAAKAERAEREPRAPSQKKRLREGKVSVAQIAQEMGILPRVARGMLRDAKWKKPEGGWVYAPGDAQIDAVKALLKSPPAKGERKSKASPVVTPPAQSTIKAGGVFTSKLKKTKVKIVPVVGEKAKAKAEAKKAIAATKKATGKKPAVTKVPQGATSKN